MNIPSRSNRAQGIQFLLEISEHVSMMNLVTYDPVENIKVIELLTNALKTWSTQKVEWLAIARLNQYHTYSAEQHSEKNINRSWIAFVKFQDSVTARRWPEQVDDKLVNIYLTGDETTAPETWSLSYQLYPSWREKYAISKFTTNNPTCIAFRQKQNTYERANLLELDKYSPRSFSADLLNCKDTAEIYNKLAATGDINKIANGHHFKKSIDQYQQAIQSKVINKFDGYHLPDHFEENLEFHKGRMNKRIYKIHTVLSNFTASQYLSRYCPKAIIARTNVRKWKARVQDINLHIYNMDIKYRNFVTEHMAKYAVEPRPLRGPCLIILSERGIGKTMLSKSTLGNSQAYNDILYSLNQELEQTIPGTMQHVSLVKSIQDHKNSTHNRYKEDLIMAFTSQIDPKTIELMHRDTTRLLTLDDMEPFPVSKREQNKNMWTGQRTTVDVKFGHPVFTLRIPCIVNTNNSDFFEKLRKCPHFKSDAIFISLSEYLGPPATYNKQERKDRAKHATEDLVHRRFQQSPSEHDSQRQPLLLSKKLQKQTKPFDIKSENLWKQLFSQPNCVLTEFYAWYWTIYPKISGYEDDLCILVEWTEQEQNKLTSIVVNNTIDIWDCLNDSIKSKALWLSFAELDPTQCEAVVKRLEKQFEYKSQIRSPLLQQSRVIPSDIENMEGLRELDHYQESDISICSDTNKHQTQLSLKPDYGEIERRKWQQKERDWKNRETLLVNKLKETNQKIKEERLEFRKRLIYKDVEKKTSDDLWKQFGKDKTKDHSLVMDKMKQHLNQKDAEIEKLKECLKQKDLQLLTLSAQVSRGRRSDKTMVCIPENSTGEEEEIVGSDDSLKSGGKRVRLEYSTESTEETNIKKQRCERDE